jgi:hypothetical protein
MHSRLRHFPMIVPRIAFVSQNSELQNQMKSLCANTDVMGRGICKRIDVMTIVF